MQILDLIYSELEGVNPDYDDPENESTIQWIVKNASFKYIKNNQCGVYDYIFNLAMLDHLNIDGLKKETIDHLVKLRDQGNHYILFNQGC